MKKHWWQSASELSRGEMACRYRDSMTSRFQVLERKAGKALQEGLFGLGGMRQVPMSDSTHLIGEPINVWEKKSFRRDLSGMEQTGQRNEKQVCGVDNARQQR